MNKFEIYVKKDVSAFDNKITHWVISYENGKLSWKIRDDNYISRYADISNGNIIFNGELMLPETVSVETMAFFKSITPDIIVESKQLSEAFEIAEDFVGCSRAEVGAYVGMLTSASNYLSDFVTKYDVHSSETGKQMQMS